MHTAKYIEVEARVARSLEIFSKTFFQ